MDFIHKLKKRKQTPIENKQIDVFVKTDHDSYGIDTNMEGQIHVSPRRDTSVKPIFKDTNNHDVNANVYDTDAMNLSNKHTNINMGEGMKTIETTTTTIVETIVVPPPQPFSPPPSYITLISSTGLYPTLVVSCKN